MRQRRRAERGRFGSRINQAQDRRNSERMQQRFLIWGGAILGVVLLLLLAGGWVMTSYLPARETLAVVDGERVETRDIVAYTQLEGITIGRYDPARALNNYVRDVILRQQAEAMGVSVTDEDIDRAIAESFDPEFDAEDPAASLTPEAIERFEERLRLIGVGERDYRAWLEGRLLQDAFAAHFESEVPEAMEQVFVHWIITQTAAEAQDAFDRIEGGEEFAAVAQEMNLEEFFADENGEVGWAPAGAWEGLDPHLFGEEAVYGEAVGPLAIPQLGNLVLEVSDGPSEEPVHEDIRVLLGLRGLQDWIDDQTSALVTELGMTNADARWIIGQLT